MRTSTERHTAPLATLINVALERGIIDAAQRDQLAALSAELMAMPGHSREERDDAAPVREVQRGFNAITVAYSLGALLVLFALAWFLLERWKVLGPFGVLVVALLLKVLDHFTKRFASGRIRRVEHPSAFRTRPALKILAIDPYQFATHRLHGHPAI